MGRETIEEILQMLALAKQSRTLAKAVVSDEDGTYALREISLVGYPFIVTGNPLRLEDTTASDDTLAIPTHPSMRMSNAMAILNSLR